MTDLYSKLPEVEAAVLAILSDVEALEEVAISIDDEPADAKYVWLYKTESNREYLGLGHRPAHLRESIRLWIRVFVTGGGKVADIKATCDEVARSVEGALREELTLRGTVEFHRIENLRRERVSLDDRKGFQVVMTVTGQMRI